MPGFPYKGGGCNARCRLPLSSAGTMSYFHEPEQTSYNVTPGQEIDISMSVCKDQPGIIDKIYIQFEQTILQRIHSMLDMLIVKLGGTV